jgi:hypothetical protein
MKTYPTIPKKIQDVEVYAFDKLDGSNIRAEWSKKRGFYKYGTRKRLLDANEQPFGQAVELINDVYGQRLNRRFTDRKFERAIAFFEFFGPNSFAGFHEEDDTFDVVLFDVAVYRKGIMPPKDFLNMVSGLKVPDLVHVGKADDSFIQQVRSGQHPKVTHEGVVCKYVVRKEQVGMFKIKTQDWLDSLKTKCGDDDKMFEKLA